ncbi:putative RNA-directed DNA polymerase, eukaryota, reverse transcriptase zinc-binding domain protein [Tanacetum coccineum]
MPIIVDGVHVWEDDYYDDDSGFEINPPDHDYRGGGSWIQDEGDKSDDDDSMENESLARSKFSNVRHVGSSKNTITRKDSYNDQLCEGQTTALVTPQRSKPEHSHSPHFVPDTQFKVISPSAQKSEVGHLSEVEKTLVLPENASGDFNEARHEHERLGTIFCNRGATLFNGFINDFGLIDLPMGDKKFTRMDKFSTKLSKIDRILVSHHFTCNWPNTQLTALPRKHSDHCPLVLKTHSTDFGPIPSKFFNSWLLDKDFPSIISSSWYNHYRPNSSYQNHYPSTLLKSKLQSLKKHIRDWRASVAFKEHGKISEFKAKISVPDTKAEHDSLGEHEIVELIVNGSPTKEFKINKGLRQGDPLSPFLFIISVEALHVSLQEAKSKGIFEGVNIGSDNVNISHLQFADDALIIGKWSYENAKNLCRILRCFHLASGLKVNFSKSKLFGVGATRVETNWLAPSLYCQASSLPCIYLGLPIGANMNKVCNWKPVIDKFHNRLSTWKAKTLSYGGRLTLIKSVLGALGNLMLFGIMSTSIYGSKGGLDLTSHSHIRGPWKSIIDLRSHLLKFNLDLQSVFMRKVRDRSSFCFWEDVWHGALTLKETFPRLYHLKTFKFCKIIHRCSMGSGLDRFSWAWRRPLRSGLESSQLAALLDHLQHLCITSDRDTWEF